MKISEWINHFESLDHNRKQDLYNALSILQTDPELKKCYNTDFENLKFAIAKTDKTLMECYIR